MLDVFREYKERKQQFSWIKMALLGIKNRIRIEIARAVGEPDDTGIPLYGRDPDHAGIAPLRFRGKHKQLGLGRLGPRAWKGVGFFPYNVGIACLESTVIGSALRPFPVPGLILRVRVRIARTLHALPIQKELTE